MNSNSFLTYFFLCFITSTGVLLTFVCNDRMSETVDEMDSTSKGILNEAISFINRTVGVSCNIHVTYERYGVLMVISVKAGLIPGKGSLCPLLHLRHLTLTVLPLYLPLSPQYMYGLLIKCEVNI